MWMSAVCSAVVNNGLDSRLFLKSLYWATMAHQVLEVYKSLPITQTTNRVLLQNCSNYFTTSTF